MASIAAVDQPAEQKKLERINAGLVDCCGRVLYVERHMLA